MRKLGVLAGTLVAMAFATTAQAFEPSTPTIVVDAKDDVGHDIGDATVAIDGHVVASSIDGHELAVDVGPHTIAVTYYGVTKKEAIIAKAGEQMRQVHVTFGRGGVAAAGSSEPAPPPVNDKPHHSSIGPIAVMGMGAAMAVTGIALFGIAPALPPNCSTANHLCSASNADGSRRDANQVAQDQDDASKHLQRQEVGGVLIAGGAAVAVGGLIWFLLDKPTKPRTARIAPWLSAGSGGLSAAGSF